jgi:hypothetical protein
VYSPIKAKEIIVTVQATFQLIMAITNNLPLACHAEHREAPDFSTKGMIITIMILEHKTLT